MFHSRVWPRRGSARPLRFIKGRRPISACPYTGGPNEGTLLVRGNPPSGSLGQIQVVCCLKHDINSHSLWGELWPPNRGPELEAYSGD